MLKRILSVYFSLYLLMLGFVPIRSAGAQERKQFTIAVMNLQAKGVSEVEAEVLSEKLRSHIIQLVSSAEYKQMEGKDQYQVVEREQMDKIFEEFDLQSVGCVSDSCAIEFGKMLQADRILQGTLGKVGETFSISARILDVGSTKTVASITKDLRGTIDEVISTTILEVGDELLIGKKKKSRKLWYIIGGVLVAAGAGAALGGGGGGDEETPLPQLPAPPGRP
ncbi:MAG: hypothetical protein HOC71_05975 [Candidatus Latescibacteria bacterium]|jgi:hypothetical protein|nr:hypothetical protein [Candidatus Latescibacterota bacterium]